MDAQGVGTRVNSDIRPLFEVRWNGYMENPWPKWESGQCVDCHLTVINQYTYQFTDLIFHLRRSEDWPNEVVCVLCAQNRRDAHSLMHLYKQ